MSDFHSGYDRHRPRPPAALLDLFCRLAGVERPTLVVDLGSGTGLSTRAWAGRAERVVGVEPDPGMRAFAEARGGGVEFVAGDSAATGLVDACADVVTASQSLHWMDPQPTFAEAARVLRPGGVFAAYDYDAVPAVDPEIDEVFARVLERAEERRRGAGVLAPWPTRHVVPKDTHLENMRASGRFRFVREVVGHNLELGDAERVVGLVGSFGEVAVRGGADVGLDELRHAAERVLDGRTVPFWIGYRARVGIV